MSFSTVKVALMLFSIAATVSAKGNLLEQRLRELRLRNYYAEQYIQHYEIGLEEVTCNNTDKNATTGEPTTNRCLGVNCKRDDQCSENYCVTNPQSKQLQPTFLCANNTYRPICNYSKKFNEFDQQEKLNTVWSTELCGDVECDWNADCAFNLACSNPLYQEFPVCNGYFPTCNSSLVVVISKNYTQEQDNLVKVPSLNRCNNTACNKTSECNSSCWNAKSCGGPECNFTASYNFWNESTQQIENTSSTDLCGGFECLNDDICKYGCANATQCYNYFTYCNNSYMVQVYDDKTQKKIMIPSMDRCEFTPCQSFDQCFDGNDCYNGTCLNQYNFCNRTAAYQSFNDSDGNWTISKSENRCLGTQCYSTTQCAFDHQRKLSCNNATCSNQNCNSSYIYLSYSDPSETVFSKSSAENRCPGIPCSGDVSCSSNQCFNASCLSSFQQKPPCNTSYAYQSFDEDSQKTTFGTSNNRCFQIQCQINETCQSGKCYNGVCLDKGQPFPICNASSAYVVFSDTNMTDESVVSLNRCSGSICDFDNQCSTGYCCSGKDCNAQSGPVCITKPGNADDGKSNTAVTVLAIFGGLLLIALIVLGVFFYQRKKQMDALRAELARSQAGNSIVIPDNKPLLNPTNHTNE